MISKVIPTWLQLMLMSSALIAVCSAEDMCINGSAFAFLAKGRASGNIIKSLTTHGPMFCARVCLLWKRCGTFSFESATGLCELSSPVSEPYNRKDPDTFVTSNIKVWPTTLSGTFSKHVCPRSKTHKANSQQTCNGVKCLSSEKALISNATNEIADEDIRKRYCDKDVFPSYESASCESNGSLTSIPCRLTLPTSCLEIKHCLPINGDYWINIPMFDLYRARVYCHGMDSNAPKSYLTLPFINYGVFPSRSNFNCFFDTSLDHACGSADGEAWYRKIRINLETMSINRTDYTFAKFSKAQLPYGQARDCYTPMTDRRSGSCRTRDKTGTFTIHLSGTGWIINPKQTWYATGWQAGIESITRHSSGSVVELKCGGYSGGCIPVGSLTLVPNPVDTPDEHLGVAVSCKDKHA